MVKTDFFFYKTKSKIVFLYANLANIFVQKGTYNNLFQKIVFTDSINLKFGYFKSFEKDKD